MTFRSYTDSSSFSLIQSGQRIIEPRLYDDAHRRLKLGDLLFLINRTTGQELMAKVVGLLRQPSFKALFNTYPIERFGQTEAELLRTMRGYYTADQERMHGVVGIKIHLLKTRERHHGN